MGFARVEKKIEIIIYKYTNTQISFINKQTHIVTVIIYLCFAIKNLSVVF